MVGFCLCSKVFCVDDEDVRELLASENMVLANNTLRGSSILMCNYFLHCGGTPLVVLTLPPQISRTSPTKNVQRQRPYAQCAIDGVCPLHATRQISTFLGSGASADQANFSSFIKPLFLGSPQQAWHEQQPQRPSVSLCGCFNWPSLW